VDGQDPQAITEIARAAQGPVRGVIDLVGSPETAALGFDLLPKGGKLVIGGLFGGGAPWAPPLIPITRDNPGQLCRHSTSYASSLSSPTPARFRHSHYPAPARRGERRARGPARG
jgi:threonine dehydrogenase-like Zn-dependent dehydrogenase